MKKLMFLFVLALFFVAACDKKDDEVTPNPPPPPPPPEIKAEIVVKFSSFPEDMLNFYIMSFGLMDADSNFITQNLADDDQVIKYPGFTYQLPKEMAEKYFGKTIGIYIGACRAFPPGLCWGMEKIVMLESLQETQEVYIEIPGRDEKSVEIKSP